MANTLYVQGAQGLSNAEIVWAGDGADTVRGLLVDASAYVPDINANKFLSDIPAAARVATSPPLAGRTVVAGVADADDLTGALAFPDVVPGEADYLVLYADKGSDAASRLILFVDTADVLPVTPAGTDIEVVWDNGPNKVFQMPPGTGVGMPTVRRIPITVSGDCVPWKIDPTCLPVGWDPNPSMWDPAQQAAYYKAQEILDRLTGFRFRVCPVVLRPCRKPCAGPISLGPGGMWWSPSWPAYGPYPFLRGGIWYNTCFCGSGDNCSCGPVCEVELPGPVLKVVEVREDGVILDPSLYELQRNRTLLRKGGGCWPWCQDVTLPSTEPGTFEVTFLRGRDTGPAGQGALTAYMVELWKACTGDKSCRLPRRVSSVVRQGVEITFVDPTKLAQAGLTGLPDVDTWISAVNPFRLPQDSEVWYPGQRNGRRRTGA